MTIKHWADRLIDNEIKGATVAMLAEIDDLRAAIGQPESEPVAYSVGNTLHWHTGKGLTNAQLYAAPQAAGYVPLSDEDIKLIQHSDPAYMTCSCISFARAIERAVRGGE